MLIIFIYLLPSVILIALAAYKNFKRHKYYRIFYKSLAFKTYYRFNDFVYSHRFNDKEDGFIWFLDKNWFRLDNAYLADCFADPVGIYWKRKFQRWFKENIELQYLRAYNSPPSCASKIMAEHEFPSSYMYDAYLRTYYVGVTLRALAVKEAINEAVVRNVIEVATKLVAELRFKVKHDQEEAKGR